MAVQLPKHLTSEISKVEITQEKRKTLMHFNTARFWHCYYDKETDVLYDEYGCRLMDNAFDYLLSIKAIDKYKNFLNYFEEE